MTGKADWLTKAHGQAGIPHFCGPQYILFLDKAGRALLMESAAAEAILSFFSWHEDTCKSKLLRSSIAGSFRGVER
jgi:hypothetical protein